MRLLRPVRWGDLPQHGRTFGATWADVDGDGVLDLCLSRHAGAPEFYLNRPGLHYTLMQDMTGEPAGIRDLHGSAACDFDGDGRWDLFLSVGAHRGDSLTYKQLWLQQAPGRFINVVGHQDFLADPHGRGRGALCFPLDGDRFPELLLLNFKSPPLLFHFDGANWSDIGDHLVLKPPATAAGPWFAFGAEGDLDLDGHTDLCLAGSRLAVLHNDGAGRLEDVTVAAGLAVHGAPIADVLLGDVDDDGDLDLLLVQKDGELRLFLNDSSRHGLRFVPGPDLSHLRVKSLLSSATLADLDGDGILDLYVVSVGSQDLGSSNIMARGLGNGDFERMGSRWGGLPVFPSDGVQAWALDQDLDGDLDLLVVSGGGTTPCARELMALYENVGSAPGLTVTLKPHGGPPHGLGARVALRAAGRMQTQEVRSVAKPWNSAILPLHFGLAQDRGPYHVLVTWCGGRRDEFVLPVPGQAYVLQEGVATPQILSRTLPAREPAEAPR